MFAWAGAWRPETLPFDGCGRGCQTWDGAVGHDVAGETDLQSFAIAFADDGDVPNNSLPLIVYQGAIDPSGADPAVEFEALFRDHGWGGSWRNGIFPFHHYHSTAHEVLGIAAGEAEVRFGGEAGETITVRAGDAVLIPAGVGHKRLSATTDLLVIGAYPGGQRADLMREGAEDKDGIRGRIAKVAMPAADPVVGNGGPMAEHWTAVSRRR